MYAQEIYSLSRQLTHAAVSLVRLLERAQVAINPDNMDPCPWFDRATSELCWGNRDGTMAVVRFSDIRVRDLAGWSRELQDPQVTQSMPVEAIRRSWDNNSTAPINVTLDRSVSLQEGVQSVVADQANWNHTWGLGSSLKATVDTMVSAGVQAGVVSSNAEASVSLDDAINATYGGSTGGSRSQTDTTSNSTSTTRRVQQTFTVPARCRFTALATYQAQTLRVPYRDTLAVDCAFRLPLLRLRRGTFMGNGQTTGRYQGPPILLQGPSLMEWLEGFYGNPPPGCKTFRPGLDVTFPANEDEAEVSRMVSYLRESEAFTIERTGHVLWQQAKGFDLNTHQEA